MRIAFDASVLARPEPTGVERAAATLLGALIAGADDDLLLLSDGALPDSLLASLPSSSQVEQAGASRQPTALWRETIVPRTLRAWGADLLHAPVVALPVRAPCPVVVTVHELPAWDEDDLSGGARARHHLRTQWAARRAAALCCVSERTRRRLVARHPGCADRAHVVPHGVDPRFSPGPADARGLPAETAARLGLEGLGSRGLGPKGAGYVLVVGRLRRKKNVALAVAAMAALDPGVRRDRHLVCVGPDGDAAPALAERVAGDARVQRPGFVGDDDLVRLYRGADLVLSTSRHEGFGLPVLEAMACGVPVLASRDGVVEEAGGSAAMRFDAGRDVDHPSSLAAMLATALTDTGRREAAVADGRRLAEQRSAAAMAAATRAVWSAVRGGALR